MNILTMLLCVLAVSAHGTSHGEESKINTLDVNFIMPFHSNHVGKSGLNEVNTGYGLEVKWKDLWWGGSTYTDSYHQRNKYISATKYWDAFKNGVADVKLGLIMGLGTHSLIDDGNTFSPMIVPTARGFIGDHGLNVTYLPGNIIGYQYVYKIQLRK